MSSKNKLLKKLGNFASDKNWTLAEAELILTQSGFAKRTADGSHRIFNHPLLDQPVVLVEHGKGIKPCY